MQLCHTLPVIASGFAAKIVDSARRLFNRRGFESVSVDSIMAQAGLTRGGFYSYFDSKSDLYAEVLGCFFTDPNWKNQWEGVEVNPALGGSRPANRTRLPTRSSTSTTSKIRVRCQPCHAMWRAATERVKSACETVFRAMVAVLGRDVRDGSVGKTPPWPSRLFASAEWWWRDR